MDTCQNSFCLRETFRVHTHPMEYHLYPVPIPTQTLSVHRQLYVLEMDAHALLDTYESTSDLASIRKRLHYSLYIHNEAQTLVDGSLIHKDSRFLVTFPYSGTLPVCFVLYTLAVETSAHEFEDVCKAHAFIERPAASNVALAIARPALYDEEEDDEDEDEGEEDDEEEDEGEEDDEEEDEGEEDEGEEDEEEDEGEEDDEEEDEGEEDEEEDEGEEEHGEEGDVKEEQDTDGKEEHNGKEADEEGDVMNSETEEAEANPEEAVEHEDSALIEGTAEVATEEPRTATQSVAVPRISATSSVDGAFEAQVSQRAYPMDVGTPPTPPSRQVPRCHVTVTAEQVLRSAQVP